MPDQIKLVENGEPVFSLEVRPSQDVDSILPVVIELSTHLERCLNREVTWFKRGSKDMPRSRLVLSFSPERRFKRDEFEIAAGGNTVTLTASTKQALGHAVSHFLEAGFGVRWLWPGATGTVTPRAVAVSWPAGTQRFEPDWYWRRIWLGGAFWQEDDATFAELKVARVRPATFEALHQWQRRNRLGGLQIADGHRWAQICSPLVYGKTHPEYFALVDGKRDTEYYDGKHKNQPCTSNPEVIKLVAEYLAAQFDARPELDGFSFAVNDGHGFCECDACRAIDAWARADTHEEDDLDRTTTETIPFAGDGRHVSITDRMLRFANEVAARVAEVYPDKLLMVLIYSQYRNPPKRVRLRRNVLAQFCTASWSHAKRSIHDHEIRTLRGLAAFTRQRGIYDYFINGANGTFPRGFARVFHGCLRDYYDAGCRCFATQAGLDFATNGFAYYLAARSLWDMSTGFEEILDDYCRHGFGPAAATIRRYLCAFFDRWEATDGGAAFEAKCVEMLAAKLYDEAWLAERRADLRQALALAGGDEALQKRIKFLVTGFDFVELFCEASRAAYELYEAGAPYRTPGWEEALREWVRGFADGAKISRAVRARQRLLDWVGAHEDGFWISAMWFRYRQSGGLLGQWLDRIREVSDGG